MHTGVQVHVLQHLLEHTKLCKSRDSGTWDLGLIRQAGMGADGWGLQGLMAGGDPSGDVMPNMEDIPDLDNLFAGLGGGDASEGSGEAFNTDDFMEGMMEQLLSKELMYEHMKQDTEKIPECLASKKDKLHPEE